jgi:hypothetical protein
LCGPDCLRGIRRRRDLPVPGVRAPNSRAAKSDSGRSGVRTCVGRISLREFGAGAICRAQASERRIPRRGVLRGTRPVRGSVSRFGLRFPQDSDGPVRTRSRRSGNRWRGSRPGPCSVRLRRVAVASDLDTRRRRRCPGAGRVNAVNSSLGARRRASGELSVPGPGEPRIRRGRGVE